MISKTNDQSIYDICVLGGGINGTGIANDAAGRGLKVILCEQNDLGSLTSSASSKLIHGGLRYLEYFEFKLVRQALLEREILLNKAPHLIHPIEFIMPHKNNLRPLWLIRIGLWLYDHLAKRRFLKKSHIINLTRHQAGAALLDNYKKGFLYSDCWVDDARLVIANALQAKENQALILVRHRIIKAVQVNQLWEITIKDCVNQKIFIIKARTLINASGPMLNLNLKALQLQSDFNLTLVKGSHIIVKKLFEGAQAYTLQNFDGRVIFAIPYLNEFTLIGTTELAYDDDFDHLTISQEEILYLLEATNRYFKKALTQNDIVSSYSGVRPLQHNLTKEFKAISRDYYLELKHENSRAILVNIIGGKITTYRKLAEQTLNLLKEYFPEMGPNWTQCSPLPGGDFKFSEFSIYLADLKKQYSFIPEAALYRYLRCYGTRLQKWLGNVKEVTDLGKCFGSDLYELEVKYLIDHEWALTAEDILWRRTKTGIFFKEHERIGLENWLAQNKKK